MKITPCSLLAVLLLFSSCSSLPLFEFEEVSDGSEDLFSAETSSIAKTPATAGIGLISAERAKAKAAVTEANPQVAQGLRQKPRASANAGLELFAGEQPTPAIDSQQAQDEQPLPRPTEQPAPLSNTLTSEQGGYVDKGMSNCFDLTWPIPTTAVRSYQIKFGANENNLNGLVVVPIELLTKAEHPQYGPVYQYQLLCNPRVQQLFVTINAENSFGRSAESAPTRIKGQ